MNKARQILEKYIILSDQYRKRNFKNIEDVVVEDIHVNDIFIFPKRWFSIKDYELKNTLLEKSLKDNVPIENLKEYEILMEEYYYNVVTRQKSN